MKLFITLILILFTFSTVSAQYNVEEFIFDGSPLTPNIEEQGMDMHSFNDGTYIWYPYAEYLGGDTYTNHIIKYTIATGAAEVFPLAVETSEARAYQAIPSSNPATPDIIWVYSAYNARSIWWFNKDTEATGWLLFDDNTGGTGGKIVSLMIGAEEYLVTTAVANSGYPQAARVSDATQTTFTALGLTSYGIQVDQYNNIFMLKWTALASSLTAFTITDTDPSVATATTPITTEGGVDLAWDGTYLWTGSRLTSTSKVEKFRPIYNGSNIVTGFTRLGVHDTGSTTTALPASIKTTNDYVVAVWESGGNDPPTLGWSILNRNTNVWTDYFNSTADPFDAVNPVAVYPYSSQFWTTVCAEVIADEIYITGYSPALQGGVMNINNCPNKSMRLLKLTPSTVSFSGVTMSGIALE